MKGLVSGSSPMTTYIVFTKLSKCSESSYTAVSRQRFRSTLTRPWLAALLHSRHLFAKGDQAHVNSFIIEFPSIFKRRSTKAVAWSVFRKAHLDRLHKVLTESFLLLRIRFTTQALSVKVLDPLQPLLRPSGDFWAAYRRCCAQPTGTGRL